MVASGLPLLSIIVLTYNHQRYISDALRSVIGLDYPNKEICVLDDGSSDDTFRIAQAVLSTAPCPVQLVTQPQSGGQISKNSQKLVMMAKGDYILPISGDDMLTYSFAIASMIQQMEANPSLAVIFPRAVLVQQSDASHQLESIYSSELTTLMRSSDPHRMLEGHLYKSVSRLFVQGTVLRRTFVDEFGGFDEGLIADDYAFFMRAFQSMARSRRHFHFDEDSLWIYRRHGSSVHADVPRQRELIYEVVAKYVPPEFWPDFRFDHPAPTTSEDVPGYCEQLRQHFGEMADKHLIPKMYDHMQMQLLRDSFRQRNVRKVLSVLLRSTPGMRRDLCRRFLALPDRA